MIDKTNNPRIEFTSHFNKQRKAAPLDIKVAFRETLELFLHDPLHPTLRNHALQGKFTGYRSIDVTSDWRAIYKQVNTIEMTFIYFVALGNHEQLYG